MTTLLIALQTVAGIAWGYLGAAVGAGLSTIGAGIGIGIATKAAVEAVARQPEASSKIMTLLILGGALAVSGFLLQTFFGNPIAGPFVLGISSTVAPLKLGNIQMFDFATLLAGAVFLWIFCKFGKRYHYITRFEGAILTLCAIAYYIYKVLNA